MEKEYYNPEESYTRSEIENLQNERLRNVVSHCVNSSFYRKRFEDNGLKPSDIRNLDDLAKIPFTTKQDLRDTYPFGIASAPLRDCIRLHSSSGTTGNPTVALYTKNDVDQWSNAIARCLWMIGCRPDDVFQNPVGYGLFTGGLGFHYGAERLGMLTIPSATGNTLRQLKIIRDYGTTVIHSIPSYVSRLIEKMDEIGMDPAKDTNLRRLIIGGEPSTAKTKEYFERRLGVKAFGSYGLTEMMGPGVAFECKEQNGFHIWEDYFIAEIVDPDTLERVPDGCVGELVLTSINREAMPLLRYRTRDLTRIIPEDCACGRQHKRFDRIIGRTDDMIILKGVNIFPIQIETILNGFEELSSNYLITLDTFGSGDVMILDVEIRDAVNAGNAARALLEKEIKIKLRDEILVTPIVRLNPKNTLPVSDGKAVRVVDKRNKF